jgi:YYY domain-containing protein
VTWVEAAVRWYVVLVAITWAMAPGVRWLCDRLPDRGAALTRPLAVLAAVYPAWVAASAGLVAFRGELIWVTVALAAALGWFFTIRRGDLWSWICSLAAVEIASVGLFLVFIWLRGFTPQILGTEKPMDVAFLASSMRAVAMPPPDPWFAGEPINYYYLGYLLHGAIGRLAAIPPEIGFNLALATSFSTTVVAAFGVAWNVVRAWSGRPLAVACGALAAFAVAIAGNLYAPLRLIQDAPATLSAWWWDSVEGIGWRSSRIVCDGPRVDNLCPFPATETINEFPFFSFLLGDLHPHLMALPYSLVAIGLGWNLWNGGNGADQEKSRSRWGRIVVCGAVAGAFYPLNAWDFPTYVLLMAAGVWVGSGAAARKAVRPLAVLAASAIVAWIPFLILYDPPTSDAGLSGLARVPVVSSVLSAVAFHVGERTSLGEYLTIFGVPFVFGIGLLLIVWRDEAERGERIEPGTLAIIGVATIVPGVILSAPVIPLCGIPLALALILLRRIQLTTARSFALVLLVFAWALSIGGEIVYVRDAFDDRMNTLFKFYYQAWTLYAIAGAVSVAVLWRSARVAWQRISLAAAVVAAVLAGLVYPVVASYQWTEGFTPWRGLDGLAYAEATAPDDVAAMRWLGEHEEPGDVVLEAAGCSYIPFDRLPFSRVSAFTGIPTVIGWANHERQWRAGQAEHIAAIPAHQSDVAGIYADPSGPIADRYGVDWIFVGDYETGNWRAECESAGPYEGVTAPSFPGPGWDEAFRSGETRVYRRVAE